MSNTSLIVGPLLRFLFPGAPEATIELYHFYIRKSAHFIEYALLAFFSARAFSTSSLKFFSSNWFLAAFSCVVWVAIIDEFDQSFEPTRTSSPWDVLLDMSGGFVMLLLFFSYKKLFTAERQEND
jgi:VanZ family protein